MPLPQKRSVESTLRAVGRGGAETYRSNTESCFVHRNRKESYSANFLGVQRKHTNPVSFSTEPLLNRKMVTRLGEISVDLSEPLSPRCV